MQALVANDQPSEFDRGRFTLLAPAQVDGRYSGVRFGVEDESAKLNLNVLLAPGAEDQARNRLLALPGMTPPIADAILDWLDADDAPREFGAESEVYNQLTPPYTPRNGPVNSLDELLLVRGVTPELLYGLDQNRNLFVDAEETPRGVLTQLDNSEGYLNRGWSAYLTLNSVEALTPNRQGAAAPTGPINVNDGQLQQLYNALKTSLTDGEAKFIIAYRQYGPLTQNVSGQNGAPGGQGGRAGNANGGGQSSAETQTTTQPATPSGPSTPAGASTPQDVRSRSGSAQAAGQSISPESIQLNFQQQGGTQINSLLDLVGAQVQIPAESQQQGQGQSGQRSRQRQRSGGAQNSQPQTVDSPWQDSQAGYHDLLKLYDAAVAAQSGRVAGRVNINSASRPVLRSIPGMTPVAINQIVAQRELEPDRLLSEQRHAIWPLVAGFVTLAEMRQFDRYVTTHGDAFSGQAVGFFDAGRTVARGEFIVDRSSTSPRLRWWRELTPYGPGFSPQLLGAQPEPKP
jgi:DNA uptake protein ComE-like DNA-binding protein